MRHFFKKSKTNENRIKTLRVPGALEIGDMHRRECECIAGSDRSGACASGQEQGGEEGLLCLSWSGGRTQEAGLQPRPSNAGRH